MGEAGGFNADLVVEGGGVKGIELVGTYLTLVERGYQIRRVGTSGLPDCADALGHQPPHVTAAAFPESPAATPSTNQRL